MSVHTGELEMAFLVLQSEADLIPSYHQGPHLLKNSQKILVDTTNLGEEEHCNIPNLRGIHPGISCCLL